MKEFFINAGVVLGFFTPTAAIIAFNIYKGNFVRDSEPYSPPDELELRRRDNETMLRHERRADFARRMKELETQTIPMCQK